MKLYYAIARYNGLVAVKRRSKTEIELTRKLDRLFAKATRQMMARVRERGAPEVVLAGMVDELDGIVYESVLREVPDVGDPSGVLREQTFTASRNTIERMKGNVLETLAEARDLGLGQDAAARMLRDNFEHMSDGELKRIARTEINGAQNTNKFAKFQKAQVQYHQWWTARDNDVRDSHEEMHGQIVRVGERFSNGMLHPHDRTGPIEEWINCRCTIVPFLMPSGMTAPRDGPFYQKELIKEAA